MRSLLVLAVLVAACGGDGSRPINVLVIGIDTLRADHVGAYGYPRPTTPRIDVFGRDAIRFETAVSQSSWTVPGFASMLTGLTPSRHGAGAGRCPEVTALDDKHETLATTLRTAGYATGAFVSNIWVGAEVGLARGFDHHEQQYKPETAVEHAIGWLRAGQRTPFFLFVHIYDPHQPWSPQPEDAALFLDPAYTGEIGPGFAGAAEPEWNDADRRRIVDLYDADVRWADRLTGRLLDALDELDLDDDTLVAISSDHGEELFEHGKLGHGHTLFDETLLVPFFIRFPGGRPSGSIARPVRTMDLYPTVLDAVGQPVPDGLDGVSLMPLVRGGELPVTNVATDAALSEHPCFAVDVRMRSFRTPREKLLTYPASGREQLFDLVADPREQIDVAAKRPEALATLRTGMAAAAAPVRDGFQLIARGGAAEGILRMRLEAPGAFRDVFLVSDERPDRFRLTHDGRVLDVKLRLTNKQAPMYGPDTDGIGFRTASDSPFVVRRLTLDGVPIPLDQVLLGDGRPAPGTTLPLELGVDTRDIVVRQAMPPAVLLPIKPRVQVSFVRHVDTPKAVIGPEMTDRLRAMGYVE